MDLAYSALDRLVHRIAFLPDMQRLAAGLERTLFSSYYESVEVVRPIFITSLPRAGTTLLLETLHLFPSLAAQTYRDMPFVLAPVQWSKLSSAFQKKPVARERAHGDGMKFGYDSPEAFEEVFWLAFWPEKYRRQIGLSGDDDYKKDAHSFLVDHMKKVVALRRRGRRNARYLSKNNGNIARLDLISRMFPDAQILVPFRNPLEHAASLLRQHRNFLEKQREPFIRRYMADLGHYEFGELRRPIAFPGFVGGDSMTLDYWLGYWIAAFEYVLDRSERLVLVSYERLCSDSHGVLSAICARLEVPEGTTLDKASAMFRTPRARSDAKSDMLDRAESVHRFLLTKSL